MRKDIFELLADPTYVLMVAEIGINHNGSIENAKQMIEASAYAGFDVVKFQKRTVELVYSKEELDAPRESPWGTTNREQKLGLEFGQDEYDQIEEHCRKHNIWWTASPWDVESLAFLMQYDLPYIKIASACAADGLLLKSAASYKKPLAVSTGMLSDNDISSVFEFLSDINANVFMAYHCTSTYPCKPEHINLRGINELGIIVDDVYRPRNVIRNEDVLIGYSGHEAGILPSVLAIGAGARSIERHVTLDRSLYGSDQQASITFAEGRDLVDAARTWGEVAGSGEIVCYDDELPVAKKLRKNTSVLGYRSKYLAG